MRLEDTDLCSRAIRVLKDAGIDTVEEAEKRLEGLLGLSGFGAVSLGEVKRVIRERNAEKNHSTRRKLTDDQAREIRFRYRQPRPTLQELADEYGVSKRTVWSIVQDEVYKERS